MSRSVVRLLAGALLLIGIAFVWWVKPSSWQLAVGTETTLAFVTSAVVVAAPAVRRQIGRALGRLRRLSPRGQRRGFVIATVASFVIILVLNLLTKSAMGVLWHDEHQFLLQSQMLARGRLWLPPHELADSFDTFYVLTRPVYAAQSFPGAAMMFVPTVWFSLPTWLMPLIVASLAAGLMWWVTARVSDGAVATVGLIAVLGCSGFRRVSTMYMAQVPALLLGLVAMAAWLKYRQTRQLRWVFVIGAALGWGLITRPLDAACYGLIVGIGVIAVWVKTNWRHALAGTACGIAGALPFLLLVLVFNHGVTGSYTKTPFGYYNERDQPALAFGETGDLSRRPLSVVPQKQWFYDKFALSYIKGATDIEGPVGHARRRIDTVAITVAPSPWAIPLVFVGLLYLRTWRRVAVFSILLLYAVAYSQYVIFLFHYVTFALPAVMLAYGAAPRVLGWCVRAPWRRGVEVATAALLVGFVWADVLMLVPPPNVLDAFTAEDNDLQQKLSRITPPAIVLFRPNRKMNMHLEPVYNDQTAWPDDAKIIRAHELTDEINHKLFAYYAARQPQRSVWLFDRGNAQLSPLGNVADLVRSFPTTRP